MANIFISYRRADSAPETGRICDRLRATFGIDEVFIDIETVPLGMDFREFVEDKVSQCRIALIVIGDHWAASDPDTGKRRIDNPQDMVRIEVEAALNREIPVIPVLVGNSPVPSASDLPDVLEKLSYRNGVEVRSDASFEGQMARLIKAIEECLPGSALKRKADTSNKPRVGVPSILIGALATIVIGGVGAWVYSEWIADPDSDSSQAQDEEAALAAPEPVIYDVEGKVTLESGGSFSFYFEDVEEEDDSRADFIVYGSDGSFALELPSDSDSDSGMVEISGGDYGVPEICAEIDPARYLSGRIPIKFEHSYCVRMRADDNYGQIQVQDLTVDEVTLIYSFIEYE